MSTGIKHNENCKKCKENIYLLLKKNYSQVERNYNASISAKGIGEFQGTEYASSLQEIYDKLQKYRKHSQFIRANYLPTCDFFVPQPGFLFEIDESQHFTIPRKIALEHYPKSLLLGFNRNQWIDLCDKLHRTDNDPIYRDEQRAWYDTLRDFLPIIKGWRPTIRICARDFQEFQWCQIDPKNPSSAETLKTIIEKRWER